MPRKELKDQFISLPDLLASIQPNIEFDFEEFLDLMEGQEEFETKLAEEIKEYKRKTGKPFIEYFE